MFNHLDDLGNTPLTLDKRCTGADCIRRLRPLPIPIRFGTGTVRQNPSRRVIGLVRYLEIVVKQGGPKQLPQSTTSAAL